MEAGVGSLAGRFALVKDLAVTTLALAYVGQNALLQPLRRGQLESHPYSV